MSYGRLSRAPEAWRARFDAARKESNAIFVHSLSTPIYAKIYNGSDIEQGTLTVSGIALALAVIELH
jgi:hypothetical protein